MLPPDPTTAEWAVAAVAAGFVAVLGGAHLVRPALTRSPARWWGRAAALLLGTGAAAIVLILAVLIATGMRADRIDLAAGTGYPVGPLAGVLVPNDVGVADDVATYAVALLLPMAATLGVLAVGVASTEARHGFRLAGGLACVLAVIMCAVLVSLDAGAAVAGVATAGVVLFGTTFVALLVDAARPS